jgi:hypothetical protein
VDGPMICIADAADLTRLARPTPLIDDMGY